MDFENIEDRLKGTIIRAYDELTTSNESDSDMNVCIYLKPPKQIKNLSKTFSPKLVFKKSMWKMDVGELIYLCGFSQYQKSWAGKHGCWNPQAFGVWLEKNKNPLATIPMSQLWDVSWSRDDKLEQCVRENLQQWDEEAARNEFIEKKVPELVEVALKRLSEL